MTSERLDEIEDQFQDGKGEMGRDEAHELIRLARLGLMHEKLQSIYGTPESQRLIQLGEWAEKHQIAISKSLAVMQKVQASNDLEAVVSYEYENALKDLQAARRSAT